MPRRKNCKAFSGRGNTGASIARSLPVLRRVHGSAEDGARIKGAPLSLCPLLSDPFFSTPPDPPPRGRKMVSSLRGPRPKPTAPPGLHGDQGGENGMNNYGALGASGASGALGASGVSGAFSAAFSAVSATFSGAVSGAFSAASGAFSAASGAFSAAFSTALGVSALDSAADSGAGAAGFCSHAVKPNAAAVRRAIRGRGFIVLCGFYQWG